jgi:hypothetical protein
MAPRWSGPPIPTKGIAFENNIQPMLAITTAQMRRFGAYQSDIDKLREDVLHCGSFEKGCEFIREWFPLDIDLQIVNMCEYNQCLYPGCPRGCEGRQSIKVRVGKNGNEQSFPHEYWGQYK